MGLRAFSIDTICVEICVAICVDICVGICVEIDVENIKKNETFMFSTHISTQKVSKVSILEALMGLRVNNIKRCDYN